MIFEQAKSCKVRHKSDWRSGFFVAENCEVKEEIVGAAKCRRLTEKETDLRMDVEEVDALPSVHLALSPTLLKTSCFLSSVTISVSSDGPNEAN